MGNTNAVVSNTKDIDGDNNNNEDTSDVHNNGADPTAGRSEFQKWKDENEVTQIDGTVSTTLEQQIELALKLWNEVAGKTDRSVAAAQIQEVLEALKATPVGNTKSIVSWSGVRVGWILDIFCKTPYMQKLLEFGCELWFVRKVCIIKIVQEAHFAENNNSHGNGDGAFPILSGPFVNFLDTVVSGLGLEGDTTEIFKTPTIFVSYTGGYTMQETLDILHQLDPKEIIWMDVFCVNQFAWTGKSRSPEMKQFKDNFLADLEKQIQAINRTALVLRDWKNVMATLGQIWVLWEIFCTAEAGSELDVVLHPAQATDFVQNCLESDENFDGIMTSLASIDANQAKAEEDGDRQGIFARMQEMGLLRVNNVASGAVRGWLYQKGQEYLAERRRAVDGPSAMLLNNLAKVLETQGRLNEAEPLYREALVKLQKVLGCDHQDTLPSLNNLATLLKSQGKLEEAESMYREALEKRQNVLGRSHPSTLASLNNLASLLKEQGSFQEAEPLFWESLEKQRKLLGRDHPDTLTSLNNLAGLLYAQGKLKEAKPLYREALKKCQNVLGNDHPNTLGCLNNLASLLQTQGRLEEAEPLYREALDKRKKVLGHDHPDTLQSLNNQASLLLAQGKLNEAEPLVREALEKRRKVLGRDHPDTLTSLNNLAELLRAKGKLKEAEPLSREALETTQKVLGHNHPTTLSFLSNLALLLDDHGKPEEAEPLYREAMEKKGELLGRSHPSTLISMGNLAVFLHAQGGEACYLEESKELLLECKTTSLAKLGANHPHTVYFCEQWDNLFG